MSISLTPDMRMRCPFCACFLTADEMREHAAHPHGCPRPLYTARDPFYCFTCGVSDPNEFSKTQLAHAAKVSCKPSRSRFVMPVTPPAGLAVEVQALR
jgi:hypothetical protein